jgi:hypothetical protein
MVSLHRAVLQLRTPSVNLLLHVAELELRTPGPENIASQFQLCFQKESAHT